MNNSVYGTFFSGILVSMIAACGGKQDPAATQPLPPTPVNVYMVKEGNAVFNDVYPATVTAVNQVDVRPQVAGYITGIYFTEGQLVHQGDKLYSIDAQQYRGAYEQAVAGLKVSEANLVKAQQDAERYEDLAQQDAIARQTLDHAIADREAAKKQVDAARANVSAVETNLRYTTIYAPFTGTIGISQVKLGAAVLPGQTVLNTISSDNPIAVDVALDQKLIPRITRLVQEKKTTIEDSTFRLLLPDQSVYPYPGHILIVDRAVDPQTGTLKVRLTFSNEKNMLKAGMTCNVMVKNQTGVNTLLVPAKALVEQMGEYFVYVVKEGKASLEKISIGPRVNDMQVVRSGLQVGDQVVTDGVQKLRDGSPVQVGPPRSAGGDSSKKAS